MTNQDNKGKDVHFMNRLFGPDRDEVWKKLSTELNANFVDGGVWQTSKVEVSHGPWTVTLDAFIVQAKDAPLPYTRMRAPYVNSGGFRFSLQRRSFMHDLAVKLGGMQDIQVGHKDFDDAFIVSASSEQKIKELLASDRIRDLLMAQPQIVLSVKDDEGWFGPKFPDGVDELQFVCGGHITDMDRLKALFDLFAETLDRLCEIGTATEASPQIKL